MSAWDKILRAVVLTLDDELKLAAKKSQPSTGKAADGSEVSGPRSNAPDESGEASGTSGAASAESGEASGASGKTSAESGEASGGSGAPSGGAPSDPQESTTTADEGAEAPPQEPMSDGEATDPQPDPTTTHEDAPASSPSAATRPEASPEPEASAPTWDFGGATDSGACVAGVGLDPAPHTVRAGAYRTHAPPVSKIPPSRVEVHLAQDDVWVRAANEPRVITEIRAWILGGIRRRRKKRPEASSKSTRFEPPPRRFASTPPDRRAARPSLELDGLVPFEKLRNSPPPTVFGAMPRRGVGLAVDTSRMPAPAPAPRPFVVSKPSWLGQPAAEPHEETSAPPQSEANAPSQSEASAPPQETSAPSEGEASTPRSGESAPVSEASARPRSEAHDDEDEDTPGVEIEPDRLGERPPVTGKGCPIPTRRRGEEWMRETLPPTTPGLVIEPERVGEAIPIMGMRARCSKPEAASPPPADTPRHAAPTSAPQRPPPEPQVPRRHVVFDDDELDDIPIFADGSHIPDPDWPEQEGYDPPPLEDDLIDLDEFCDPDDPPDESSIVLCEGVE